MATRPPYDISSYLRLSQSRRGAWWRLVVGLVAGVVGFYVVTLIALLTVKGVMALLGLHLVLDVDRITASLLLAANLGLASCIPLAAALTWAIYGLPPRWLGSTAPGLRRGWLVRCLAIASVVWGVLLVLAIGGIVATGQASLDRRAIGLIAVMVVTTPLQAAGEEYLFRGFLLQSLGATGLSAPMCWVLSGAAFATAHGQFTPPVFADRLLIGIVFAWLVTSTGGLEASIALHTVKNIAVFLPAVLIGQLSQTLEPSEQVSWAPVVLDAVMLAIAGWWIRSRSRRSVLPPPPAEVLPSGSPRA